MEYNELKKSINLTKSGLIKYQKQAENSSCDKRDLGFNKDVRFSGLKVTLSLDSWLGFYGNSFCSTALNCDDIFGQYFIAYLNKNVELLIAEVLGDMQKDLRKLVDAEIAKTRERLDVLLNEKTS